MATRPIGRPRRYAQYEELLADLPQIMAKRPRYVNGIGVFRGVRGETVWVKIRLRHGGTYKQKRYPRGHALEINLGNLSSWSWEQLEAKHAELQGKADRAEPLEEASPTLFGEWATDWLVRARSRLRGYGTAAIHVNKHLLPVFGHIPLTDITVQNVNSWTASRLEVAMPSTVKRELGTLGSILSDALRAGLIDDHPCQHANPVRGVVGRQRYLDPTELVNLLRSAQEISEWLPDFILWCVHSGMRKGEIRALLWSNIRSLHDGRTMIHVQTSKSGQPRNLTCTRTMIEILERQRGRAVERTDNVFPISKAILRNRWEDARKLANLEDVTVHDLRRTHSTLSIAAGVDVRTVAGRMGHASLAMLQEHYAAFVGSAESEAANTIQRLFDDMITDDDDPS